MLKKWQTIVSFLVTVLFLSILLGLSLSDTAQLSNQAHLENAETSETHNVTLITGDKIEIQQFPDGRSAVNFLPAEREGYVPNFEKMEINDEIYVFPEDIMEHIPDKLDKELFNITKLVEQGYDDSQTNHIPIIITLNDRDSVQTMQSSLHTETGLSDSHVFSSINGVAAEVSKDNTVFFKDILFTQNDLSLQSTDLLDEQIEYIHLDQQVTVSLEDSVPQIGTPKAWEAGYDGEGITVAVLDSGIDEEHPDLNGKVVEAQDFTADETTQDLHGHGTHVASTIAGSGEASDGAQKGVAPNASLINAKVLNQYGSGPTSNLIEGMEWAADQGASIINMSIGSFPTDGTDIVSQAVNTITEENNVLFVIASGNFGPNSETVTTPGTADSALTVGAVDNADELASFSSRGPRIGDNGIKPEITAPGVSINAARSGEIEAEGGDEYYMEASGTSMAAPHVAGAAALLAEKWIEMERDFSPEELKAALVSTAIPHEDYSIYEQGAGRLDVESFISQDIFSTTPTVHMGNLTHDDHEPVTETITYHNLSNEGVVLNVSLNITDQYGNPIDESMITFSEDELFIEANSTKSVEVILHPEYGTNGLLYGGNVTAQSGNDTTIHTPVGFYIEPEMFDLTIKAIDRNGDPADSSSRASVANMEDISHYFEASLNDWDAAGEIKTRVPSGVYSIIALIDTDGEESSFVSDLEFNIDEDSTLILDARDANPVVVDVEDEVETQSYRMSIRRDMEKSGSYVQNLIMNEQVSVASTEETTMGEFNLLTNLELVSPSDIEGNPYFYKILVTEERAFPSEMHYDINKEDLAVVHNQYYGDSFEEYGILQHAFASVFGSTAQPRYLHAGQERTEYFIPEDIEYRKSVLHHSGRRLEGPRLNYQLGESESNWYKQPIRPGNADVYREGDTLEVSIDDFADTDLHSGTGVGSSLRVYENDELIGEENWLSGSFPLTLNDGEIKIETEVDASDQGPPFSSTWTRWTFSSNSDDDIQTIAPMLFIDYDQELNLNNSAKRSDETAEEGVFHFEVNHQSGSNSNPIENANLWISYDDGNEWRKIDHVQPVGNGQFEANLDHGNPKGSGFVSLKVEAWDTEQNQIEQEIIRAYRLPVTAANMRTHVERLENEGAFTNEADTNLLKMHLTAVSQYEQQEAAEKVIRHTESFKLILDHQYDNELISDEAYDFLMADTDFILSYWEEFDDQ
ncbi:S8 family serine peptidase [Virgibacillus oceani]